jgi:Ni/Fe-hydrogenase 1 B-type cytochrome subunit
MLQGGNVMSYERVYRMNIIMRINHWLMFIAFIACAVTGFYIAHPFLVFETGEVIDSYVMGYIRLVHYLGAILLDVILLVWLYLFFFGHHSYFRFIFPLKPRFIEAMQMLKHYFTLRPEDKPETGDRMDALNAWGIFLFIIIFKALMLITGFAMLSPQITAENTAIPGGQYVFSTIGSIAYFLFGNLANIRLAHHTIAWLMIVFVLIHIYLEVWREAIWKEGDISIVFSGYKFVKKGKNK